MDVKHVFAYIVFVRAILSRVDFAIKCQLFTDD